MPVARVPGDQVVGGTVKGAGALNCRVTHVGADTVLARIVALVEQAQGGKLPVQALVDRVTLVFVPIVMAAALATVALWLALGPGLGHALVAGVLVLIIACTCAMGLATPTSILVGRARRGTGAAVSQRRCAAAAGRGVAGGVRQDRHLDTGPPGADRSGRGPGV